MTSAMDSAPRVRGRTLVLGLFLIVAIVITVVVAIAPTMADAIAERAGEPTTLVTRTPKTATRKTTSGLPVPPPTHAPASPSTAPPATWTPAGLPPPIAATTTTTTPSAPGTPRAAAFDDDAPVATDEVPPTLDKEAVKAAIAAVKPKLADCFHQALKQQPGLGGKVVVQLELVAKDGKGYVRAGEIEDSDVASPFFEACVLQEAAGAAFEAPDGDGVATIVYPFRFTPRDEAAPPAP